MTPELQRLVHIASQISVRCWPPASLSDDSYLSERLRAGEIRELEKATRAVISAGSEPMQESAEASAESLPKESRVRATREECGFGDLYPIFSSPERLATYGTRCAGCGRLYGLHQYHQVRVSGDLPTVTPSLHCPAADCRAHYLIHEGKIEWC